MQKLGLDVDGVIRNLIPKINFVFDKYYPGKRIHNNVFNYNFPHIDMPLKDKLNIIFNKYPEEIFLKSKPYSGAVSEFKLLKKWAEENDFKLVCATSQENHLISMSHIWLGKYNFDFEEIHITKDKGNIGLDFLIDDSPSNHVNWAKNGNPEENFFLVDRSWNQEVVATNRIKSISEVIEILSNKKE